MTNVRSNGFHSASSRLASSRLASSRVAWVLGLAVLTTALLAGCTAGDSDAETSDAETASTGPVFTPGIPGVKMVDVRDHKFLWREIDQLQLWERGNRLSVAEYRSKAIEKTVQFLELEGDAAKEFTVAASEAVTGVRESFSNRRPSGKSSGREGEATSSSNQLVSGLADAVDHVTAHLEDAPRHQLFEPGCKKWLLKLAFGPTEAKESREIEAAKA